MDEQLCAKMRGELDKHRIDLIITSHSLGAMKTSNLVYGRNVEAVPMEALHMPPRSAPYFMTIKKSLCEAKETDRKNFRFYYLQSDETKEAFNDYVFDTIKAIDAIIQTYEEKIDRKVENVLIVQDSKVLMIAIAVDLINLYGAEGAGCLFNLTDLAPCEGFIVTNLKPEQKMSIEYLRWDKKHNLKIIGKPKKA